MLDVLVHSDKVRVECYQVPVRVSRCQYVRVLCEVDPFTTTAPTVLVTLLGISVCTLLFAALKRYLVYYEVFHY